MDRNFINEGDVLFEKFGNKRISAVIGNARIIKNVLRYCLIAIREDNAAISFKIPRR
jgi:hypothetical protein